MPELPEVETIRLGLQKYLVGHKIESVEVKVPKLFEGAPKDIVGARVTDVRRFGKGLVIDLSNGKSLAIHIKLTGQLIFRDEKTSKLPVSEEKVGTLPSTATHIIFHLDKGATLYYNDRRRFGWIRAVNTSKVSEIPFFKNMGPEPFKDLTLEVFENLIKRSNTAIKPYIMDQTRIGGIGNIYANDALWLSDIDPRRKAKTLTSAEIKKLYDAVLSVMEKSLKFGGASELNFVNVLGQEGSYQNHSLVYGREGQKCQKNDGGTIKKFFLGGRGTYCCEEHQK